jgi:hypothetical protein
MNVRIRPIRVTSVAVYFIRLVCVCSLCYPACNVCETCSIICGLAGCTIFSDIIS